MRRTVAFDPDVAELIQAAMHRHGKSLNDVVNNAVRLGLEGAIQPKRAPSRKRTPFKVAARPLGLRPGFDPAGVNDQFK